MVPSVFFLNPGPSFTYEKKKMSTDNIKYLLVFNEGTKWLLHTRKNTNRKKNTNGCFKYFETDGIETYLNHLPIQLFVCFFFLRKCVLQLKNEINQRKNQQKKINLIITFFYV